MKQVFCILLMVYMGVMNKESSMPNVMKDDVVKKSPVPAWMGRTDKGGRENSSPVLGTPKGFGIKTGAGVVERKPTFTDALVSSAAAANTNGGGQWLTMDGKPAPQPTYVNPPAPKPQAPSWLKPVAAAIAAANTNGGGQWLSMNGKPAPQPAWMNPVQNPPQMGSRPPAYGGQYNPTVDNPANPNYQDAQAQAQAQGDPSGQAQPDTYDSYQGQPVNESMSDLLRSLMPPAWMDPNAPATGNQNAGFGTRYSGNWRRGGGGGYGGGGYGGGGYDSPAWMNNEMGLFSWKV